MTIKDFLATISENHIVFYNNKLVDMGYVSDSKKQFKLAGMRIIDNTSINDIGYIKTPNGMYYKVSHSCRTAKKVTAESIHPLT